MDKILRYMDLVMRRLEQLHEDLSSHKYNDKDTAWLIECNERMLIGLHRYYEGYPLRFRIRPAHEVGHFDVPAIEA